MIEYDPCLIGHPKMILFLILDGFCSCNTYELIALQSLIFFRTWWWFLELNVSVQEFRKIVIFSSRNLYNAQSYRNKIKMNLDL